MSAGGVYFHSLLDMAFHKVKVFFVHKSRTHEVFQAITKLRRVSAFFVIRDAASRGVTVCVTGKGLKTNRDSRL